MERNSGARHRRTPVLAKQDEWPLPLPHPYPLHANYLPMRRLLDGVERARFQGVPAELYRQMLSNVMRKTNYTTEAGAEKQIMGTLGDAMSVNVLMRILPAALKAASLWPSSLKSKDPWAESRDLASLSDRLFEAAC